jgi:lipase (class 3)
VSATYDTTQMVYCFTFSVGAAGGLSFDNSSGGGVQAMQTYATTVAKAVLADTTIQGLIGTDWVPVWGPVVYTEDPGSNTVHADNTMACYYSPSNNMFVVAVAGTNPNSPFDWLTEDFEVHTMVPWATMSGAGSGNISEGTSTGLLVLLTMKDSNSNTLLAALSSYIKANNVTKAVVAVGGHSLAGALSPCLALFLYNNRSAWDPGGTQTLSAFPTAGPTPGDSGFASYYEGVIKEGGIVYSSLYNAIDVVPHAWAESDLEQIPAIYDADIVPVSGAVPTDAFMGIVTAGLQLNALSATFLKIPINPYTQVSSGRSSLPGTFNTTVDGDITTKLKYVSLVLGTLKTYGPYLTNVARFVAQAAAQHTIAYPPLLNITAFDTEYQSILAANKPSSAAQIDGVRAGVKRLTGVDLGKIDQEGMANAAARAAAR